MASAIAPERMAELQACGDAEANDYVSLSVSGADCPIGPWVYSHAAWHDVRLTGAFTRLLLAAWNAVPAGSLPDDDEQLSSIARMPMDSFRAHRGVLLSGWHATAGRVVFGPLADRARHLVTEHGKALRQLQTEVSVASILPGAFRLQAVEAPAKRTRKSQLPADFGLHQSLAVWGAAHIAEICQRQAAKEIPANPEMVRVLTEMMQEFKTLARARRWTYDDWDSAFQIYVRRQINGDFGRLASFYFPALFPNQAVERSAPAARTGYVPAVQLVREGLENSVADALSRLSGGSMRSSAMHASPVDERTINADVVDVDQPLSRA